MYYIQNLKQNFGRFYFSRNYINNFQFLQLAKHDIYPYFDKKLIKNVPINLIIHSGKLMINLKKKDKNNKTYKKKILFAENDILYETENDNDLVLTNLKYILTISPRVYYSFYAYDYNTNFSIIL